MNNILRHPPMTREQFLDWNEIEEAPFEFDGYEPIAMPSRTIRASLISGNILWELSKRFEGTSTEVLMRMGVATTAEAVRYPDVLITQTPGLGSNRLISSPLVLFDVISLDPGRAERLSRLLGEYLTIDSIDRYIVVEQTSAALIVFERDDPGKSWRATALEAGATLDLAELGVSLPIADIYRRIKLPEEPTA